MSSSSGKIIQLSSTRMVVVPPPGQPGSVGKCTRTSSVLPFQRSPIFFSESDLRQKLLDLERKVGSNSGADKRLMMTDL